jgi:hypothetical protein
MAVGDNLLALEAGGLSTANGFCLSFRSIVFIVYDIAVQFVANGCLAASNGAGYLPDTVTLVVEYLDFVTFVFGEMDIVLSSYQSTPASLPLCIIC